MTGPRITKRLLPVVNKFLIAVTVSFALSAGYLAWQFSIPGNGFKYFSADCSIYSRSGTILFHAPEDYCDFASDGKLVTSRLDTNTLQLRDKNNEVLWSSKEYAHHDLKFSRDEKSILVITAESIMFRNWRVKSDCFSKRDLANQTIYRWCLGDNIEKLEALGFRFKPEISEDTEYETNRLINTKFEISHSNSIYEIPKNALSGKIAAFAEGNYLINIYSPSFALVILDREMKTILWTMDLGRIKSNGEILRLITHDLQVTEDGKILTHVNYFQKNPEASKVAEFFRQVSLVKMDPVTAELEWLYIEKQPRADFHSLVHGTVAILKNNNLLYSVVSDATNKSEVYEVSNKSGIVWSFKLPNETNKNSALRVKKAKPLYNTSFLKKRGIID